VTAIDDATVDVFVVEASSFRLAAVRSFRPKVGTWLNWAPDHLDVHRDLAGYQAAKARLWSTLTAHELAVANADDPVVMSHVAGVPRVETFGLGTADWHVDGGVLRAPDGTALVTVDELFRAFPHDISNALAASATARGVGATLEGVRETLRNFKGLPHRVALVGEAGGVSWYDDSKATAPHATLAAVRGFDSVVLIAGGRNKGLDLGELAGAAPQLRAVVAIGDAAGEVAAAFAGLVPVRAATTMDGAVTVAGELARPGDAVLLSPGCASFDWYRSYGERGDDFVRAVRQRLEAPA
jgi:UDP-N-acetylmuramoylalanine--D-glutamate ligase